jgi:uncharacterized membrane protein
VALLIVGIILFFGAHSVSIVNEPWRDRTAARLGEGVWQGLYGLVSLIGLVLIIWGYGLAQQTPTPAYLPPLWLRHVTLLLMLPVFPLLIATYLPGRLKGLAIHPMLLATMLWASAHLLSNGTLADLLLFGPFLIWAVADRISMGHRTQRPIPSAPPSRLNDLIAAVGGLGLYAAFLFWLHLWLFGISPLAGTA